MGIETVVTLVLVAVLVAVLAVYILAIGFALRRLSFTLGTIVIGLRAIAQQTAPVGAVVGDLIKDVDVIEDALDGLTAAVVAAKKTPRKPPPPAPVLVAPQPSRVRPPQAVAWKPEADEPEAPPNPRTGDEWDDVVAARAPGGMAPIGAVAGGRTAAQGRRAQARSSGRRLRRRTPRSAPGAASMSDAVARAREKVEAQSQP